MKSSAEEPIINIIDVEELPDNADWDYPLEELEYLLQQIKDGDRENNCTMYLYRGRLYEFKEA